MFHTSSNRTVAFESDEACSTHGHPSLIRSAFDNVLRNAVRHTGEGTAVEVALECGDDRIELTVRDHGPGVPEDHLETLFEAFSRVGDARERSTGGAGLGLAIARRAIEIHDGAISARNHDDGGLEVSITLPFGGS